ncbi:unnamed protein product [Rhizophagus irregularis]|nr:unnamed protein product [Rhizophagus irregularis]
MQKKKPLVISELSQYYFYNCDKFVRLISDKDNGNEIQNNNNGGTKKNHKTINEAMKNRGIDFELKVKNKLKNVIDCEKNVDYTMNCLKNAKNGQIFYQMKFNVPDEFYDEMQIDNIKLGAFVPDFIEVKERNSKKEIMIYDAKASKSTHISHQFQVASYAFLLEFIVKKINGLFISNTGGIYLPSSKSKTTFQLENFRLDFFFQKCRTCDFVNVCRKDAKGTISMIPYLSLAEAENLKTFISDGKSDDDIEDIAKVIKKLEIGSENFSSSEKDINRRIKHIVKYDKRLEKRSPYLKAKETNQAQFIETPTANFPQKTVHNLIISMSLDHYLSRPFAWGICLYHNSGHEIENHKYSESISKNDVSLKSFIHLISCFVIVLEDIFKYLQNMNQKLSNVSRNIQQSATKCLFNLFEDSLLLASQNNTTESFKFPNISKEWRDFPRLIVLERAISENIAFHVPGFYRFIDIRDQLVKPTLKDSKYNFIIIKKNDDFKDIEYAELENIFKLWAPGYLNSLKIINDLHLLRNDFANAIIRAYYELLKKSTNDISSILIFIPPKFTLTEVENFKNNYLGKLYFFKQYEAIKKCNRHRSDRIKDFMYGEAVYGSELQFEELNSDSKLHDSLF